MKTQAQALGRMPTLGQVVLFLALIFIVVTASITTGLTQQIRERAVADLAREEARQVAELSFLSLYSAMRKGWNQDDIATITDDLNSAMPGVNIRIFRGSPVIRQFGDIEQDRVDRQGDIELLEVFRSGNESLHTGGDEIRYLFPIRVNEECLGCHTMAKEGDINGVIDVRYHVNNLKVSLGLALNVIAMTFMAMLVLLTVIFYLFQRFYVARPIGNLADLMSEIVHHMDLGRRVKSISRIAEIAQLKNHFNRLLETLEEYQQRLEQVSTRDRLTGLFNRSKFCELTTKAIARHATGEYPGFSLIEVDLDYFKHVNDLHGPTIGDLILRQVAERISEWSGDHGVVARLGGDSFGVLLSTSNAELAYMQAVSLRDHLMNIRFGLDGEPVRIMCSIGVVTHPQDGTTAEELCAALDLAVLKAKDHGNDRVGSLNNSERGVASEFISKGDRILCALDDDRVTAEFEPIVNPATGDIFAYEALARIEEGNELIKAHKFIEAAEQLGMSETIDLRIIDSGLRAKQMGLLGKAKVFFNLSARTIANRKTMQQITSMVRERDIAPSDVVFEITEREALPQLDRVSELTASLKSEGYSFALDDFGSGFSSYMYLKYLSVDYVKIEGSFVRQILEDPKDLILVQNIARVVKDFGLAAIAEYVESSDCEKVIAKLGIQFTQGYLYADRVLRQKQFDCASDNEVTALSHVVGM